MAEAEARPNIRIEISNNLVDSMEVDDENSATGREEGEIWEENPPLPQAAPQTVTLGNRVCVHILQSRKVKVKLNNGILAVDECRWRFRNWH